MQIFDFLDIIRLATYAVLCPMWVGAAFFWFNNDRKMSALFGLSYATTTLLQLVSLATGIRIREFGPLEITYTITTTLLPLAFIFFFLDHYRTRKKLEKELIEGEIHSQGT